MPGTDDPTGRGEPRPITRETTRFPARPESLAAIHDTFDRFFAAAARAGVPVATEDRVAMLTAVGEIAGNIIEHACASVPDTEVTLVVDRHRDGVEATFVDRGREWDKKGAGPQEALPTGGMGLSIAKASVHTLAYTRSDDTNRWRLVRRTIPPC